MTLRLLRFIVELFAMDDRIVEAKRGHHKPRQEPSTIKDIAPPTGSRDAEDG
jgi:hypothetical protein